MKSKDEPLYQRAIREFRRIPGVIGVGCGLRKSGDGRSEVAVLRVIVRKKLPLSALNPTHRLPSFFDGVEIDVCERMPSVPAAESTRVLPLQGGLPLDANRGAEGTIGCFANFGSKKVILTAGHVLTELDRGDFGEGGEVGSPELDSSWCCTTGAVGNILKGRVDEAVDCGIAELATKRPVQQLIPGLGSDRTKQNTDRIVGVAPLRTQQSTGIRAPVMVGEHVRKVGATTHRTGGKIAAIDFPIPASPGDDLVAMEHQIIIFPWPGEGRRLADGKEHFCDIGDSGALIMDDDNRAAALLVRKVDLTGQPVPADTGFGGGATNIHRVIEAMQIEIFPSSGVQGTQPTRALSPGHGIFRRPTLTPEQSLRRAFVDGLKHELGKFELGPGNVESVIN